MGEQLGALMVHDSSEAFEALERALTGLSIVTYHAANFQQAKVIIFQCKPHMVFTQTVVADGPWSRMLAIAESAKVPLSVIVVGAFPDSRLYAAVMEGGGFDFIVPPFEQKALNFVIRSAALNTDARRHRPKSDVSLGTPLATRTPIRHQGDDSPAPSQRRSMMQRRSS